MDFDLSHLPLQKQLVDDACSALFTEADVVAMVLLGSLASGKGDRVSDADLLIFTQNNFHASKAPQFSWLDLAKECFYSFDGFHNSNAYFKKYLFTDLSSAELQFLDVCEPFDISKPYRILFDKQNIIPPRLTDEPAPKHADFSAYEYGDKGLIWELFDCIKWLSRDEHDLAKSYLKKLAKKL